MLIVDWDVHHGNGIQHIFESDPNVMYFSVHRYDEGFFFPATDTGLGSEGTPSSVGMGEGRGTTINIGWNTNEHSKPGDSEYLAAWRDVLMPVAREFDPDLVIVAAGFDAAEGDPLGECHVTPECFGVLTRDLMTLANGKVVLALEGGYSLSATAASVASCMEALLGVQSPAPPGSAENCDKGARLAIDQTRAAHAEFWSSISPVNKAVALKGTRSPFKPLNHTNP